MKDEPPAIQVQARLPLTSTTLSLAFAERVLPRAADLWVQASLEQRQRFPYYGRSRGTRS